MFASTTTVTWRRRTANGVDAEGNETTSIVDVSVPECAVWFEPGTEVEGDLAQQVDTFLRVVMPPGHDAPEAADQLVFLGDVYEVVAQPLRYFPDPSMTIAVGPDIRARRTSG
jgi:hypothetical protein